MSAASITEETHATTKLLRAAREGETSVVETLLTYIASSEGPAAVDAAAQAAIQVAVEAKRWETVAYLADMLADTEREPETEAAEEGGGGGDDGEPASILASAEEKAAAPDDPESITVFVCPCAAARAGVAADAGTTTE